jgi:hypothetical protein
VGREGVEKFNRGKCGYRGIVKEKDMIKCQLR